VCPCGESEEGEGTVHGGKGFRFHKCLVRGHIRRSGFLMLFFFVDTLSDEFYEGGYTDDKTM
jgi:hypothetical protein